MTMTTQELSMINTLIAGWIVLANWLHQILTLSFENQASTLSTWLSQQITDVQFVAHHHSFNQLTLDIDIVIMTVSYSLKYKTYWYI